MYIYIYLCRYIHIHIPKSKVSGVLRGKGFVACRHPPVTEKAGRTGRRQAVAAPNPDRAKPKPSTDRGPARAGDAVRRGPGKSWKISPWIEMTLPQLSEHLI